MGNVRPGARMFLLLVVVAGLGLVARPFLYGTWPVDGVSPLVLLGTIPAYTLADRSNIRLQRKGVVASLWTTVAFATLIIFGLEIATLTTLIGAVISELWDRQVWYKASFNVFAAVVVVNVAGLVFNLLNDGTAIPLTTAQNSLAIVASGVVFTTVNSVIVALMVGLAVGNHPLQVWRASFNGFWFQLATLVPIGTLIGIMYYAAPLGLLLLMFPILLTHNSYQDYQQLQSDSQRTIETLATAVDRRDPYTYRHSERVATFSEMIAQQMGLDITATETVVRAAKVHDLGKIGIESAILLKPSALDDAEWKVMKEHPRIGADIVGQLSIYEQVRDLVAYHQERYDGKGYPYGLAGEKLPPGARIIAVADAFDAMTSDRPYRKAMPTSVALARLREGSGTQFDPAVVDAFVAAVEAREMATRPALQTVEASPRVRDPLPKKQAIG